MRRRPTRTRPSPRSPRADARRVAHAHVAPRHARHAERVQRDVLDDEHVRPVDEQRPRPARGDRELEPEQEREPVRDRESRDVENRDQASLQKTRHVLLGLSGRTRSRCSENRYPRRSAGRNSDLSESSREWRPGLAPSRGFWHEPQVVTASDRSVLGLASMREAMRDPVDRTGLVELTPAVARFAGGRTYP